MCVWSAYVSSLRSKACITWAEIGWSQSDSDCFSLDSPLFLLSCWWPIRTQNLFLKFVILKVFPISLQVVKGPHWLIWDPQSCFIYSQIQTGGDRKKTTKRTREPPENAGMCWHCYTNHIPPSPLPFTQYKPPSTWMNPRSPRKCPFCLG